MYTCPVCGYGGLQDPPYNEAMGGSNEMCYSCGYEFGYHDDDQEITHEQWRERWIKEGMKWSIDEIYKPPHWNPKAQLFRIGIVVE